MPRTIQLRPDKFLGHTVHLLATPKNHPRRAEYDEQLAKYRGLWALCTADERELAPIELFAAAEARPGGRNEYTDEAISEALAFLNAK